MWENETEKYEQGDYKKDEPNIQAVQEYKGESLVLIQLFICIGILIIVLLIRLLSTELFMNLRTEYSALMCDGIDLSGQGELLRFVNGTVDSVRKATKDILSQLESENALGGYQAVNGNAMPQNVSLSPYKLTNKIFCPCNGTVSSYFGTRTNPILHKKDFHTGIDIAASSGSDVYSAFYGKVEECGYSSVRGNYIILRHSPRLVTLYQHLQFIIVREGESIKSGQRIAFVGTTGLSTGAHLHFELQIDGLCVNPSYALIFDEL
ncbi:MAG: M23 family metallopeptidase [Oscillospiraceae bacterium]